MKKFLSLVLSAVLVIATMPIFAINVSAHADNDLIAQYFSTNNVWYDTVTDSGNALEWIEGEYPAYRDGFSFFDSTYVRIRNGNLFSNVNANTGLTVSFKYYSTENTNYRHLISFGKNEGKGSSDHFYISANPSHIGGGTVPVIGYVDENDVEHINGYPSGGPAFAANKMYDVTLVITSTGVTYYINGGKYTMTGDNDSATYLAAFLGKMSTYTNNYIGFSRWNDANFNGGIKNMRFYGRALSETEVYEEQYGIHVENLKTGFDSETIKKSNVQFDTVPYHTGAECTTGYSNVVYAPAWSTSWSGDGVGDNYYDVGRISFKVATPMNTVLAYDGVNDVKFPIVLETKSNVTNDSSYRIHDACSYSTMFTLMQDWQGYWRAWNAFDVNNLEVEDNFSNNRNVDNPSDDSQRDSTSRFWWNSIGYAGTGNSTDYYDAEKNLAYYAKTSYNQNGTRTYKYGDFYSLGNNYVINYKPVYDLLNAAYQNYTTNIQNKEWMYTDASLNRMMLALYLLGQSNPNYYDYSVNAEDAVTDCANTIKLATRLYADAVQAGLVKKQFTVNFVKVDNSSTSKTITAGDALGTLPANTETVHILGSATHNVYSWGCTSGTIVQQDTTFNEVANAEDCNFTASYVWPTATMNGYTEYTCSVCGYTDTSRRVYDALDWSGYDNAVNEYNSIISNANYANKYTASSRTAYEARVANALIEKDNSLTQAAVNAAATAVSSSKSELQIQTYTVKFVKANGDETTRTKEYGESVGALPANTNETHIEGTETHNAYSWGCSSDTLVTGDVTYNEIAEPEDCYFTGHHTAVTATTNGYTDYTCNFCGYTSMNRRAYDAQDWSAYDAAVADYNATISDADYTADYTAASRTAYETRVQNAQMVKADSVPQPLIDSATAEIIAAKNELVAQDCSVVFNVFVDGASVYTDTENYAKDATVTLEVPAQYKNGAEVYKWTYSVDGDEADTFNTKSSSMTYIAGANAEYSAYLTTGNEQVPAASSKATVYGMNETVTDIGYIENGTYDVSLNRSGGIEIGSKTFKSKQYAFYTLTGFEINGEVYTASDFKSLTVNGDFDIYAQYEPVSLATINFDGCYEVKNPNANSINAPFDQKLEVSANDATDTTAWYVTDTSGKRTLIGYGKSITTRVTDSATISKENANAAQPSVALEYFAYDAHKPNTTTVIGSYYLPEDCEFVEAGFVLKTDRTTSGYETQNNYSGATTLTEEQLTTANANGVFKVSGIADTNQFMFNISRTADTHFIMGARTYLKYRQGGEVKTAYSDMRLIAYAG